MKRKYRKHDHFDSIREDLIQIMNHEKPHSPENQVFHDILLNIEKMKHAQFNSMELRLIGSAIGELRHALSVFKDYYKTPKAAVFGSARTPKAHPDYKIAKKFGTSLKKRGWMTITGGASGIMEAAMVGAGTRMSFGLNIRLPFEQDPNPVIRNNRKLMNFKYFFTRKLMFLKESAATVLFPGGYGTFDEGFESLTLIQTGKAKPRPVVLVDPPGSRYWETVLDAMRESMEKEKWISPGDLSLMRHFQDADLAADEIVNFYSNYHSSRFLKDEYLIRVRRKIKASQLRYINKEFKDLLESGTFRVMKKIDIDDDTNPKLGRLIFKFNRSHYARLRLLIDYLNEK